MTQSPQHSVNDAAWARRIEPVSEATWPARQTVQLEGWQLRFSGGHSHRCNSVAAFEFSGNDVAGAIDRAEAQYRSRGLKPMFQVTAAVKPANLAEVLTRRGYRPITPSLVCFAGTAAVRGCCGDIGTGRLRFDANADFDALVVEGLHSRDDGRERLETLSRIRLPLMRATVFVDDKRVSCGMAAAADGLAGINLMRTHPDFRRRGLARRVLGAIAGWGLAQRIETLFLTVEEANAPARALYRSAGFEVAYDYLYYVRD
ncbi:MAG TPA: GNAT family N-acetyltransferase [Rhizomicrobium sp.]|nr:GNAT family N-acetyltransferase [Rhizomicrobium sp.]